MRKVVEDLSPAIAELIKGSKIPAMSLGVVLDGQLIAQGVSGIRKKGETALVTINDKFHIGSITKSMTATLAAILVEEGRIGWHSTIGEVFSDLPIDEAFKQVTLQQLLSNTAGIAENVPSTLWAQAWHAEGSARKQRYQMAQGILAKPPFIKPGSRYLYSNVGFSVAGVMMEQVTDIDYEHLLREKLFQPLRMSGAGFRAPATGGAIDQPYGHRKSWFSLKAVAPEPMGDNPAAIAPAGAVHLTIDDFAKYAVFHMGLGNSIISKENFNKLHTPVSKDYALGWSVLERNWAGNMALNHAGSNTMFAANIWIAPEKQFAVFGMTNSGAMQSFRKLDKAFTVMISKYIGD